MKKFLSFLSVSLGSLRTRKFRGKVSYDDVHCVYNDTSVFRGFPLGTIGSGGLGLDTAGGFIDLRLNNNWMRPIRHVKGSFWALSCHPEGGSRDTRILRRRYSGGREYANVKAVDHAMFLGRLPCYEQEFYGELPVRAVVHGFSPLVPRNIKDSTLPVTVFRVELHNDADVAVDTSFLFSWENVLGCGGTGQTGVVLQGTQPRKLKGHLRYDDRRGNVQTPVAWDGLRGLRFSTEQEWPANSHRRSVLGEYLLLAEEQEGISLSWEALWDAKERRPEMLTRFCREGELPGSVGFPAKDASARGAEATAAAQGGGGKKAQRPAGALCARCRLEPHETRSVVFFLVWWLPEHVTEDEAVERAQGGEHAGVRVGHIYEEHFGSAEEVAGYVASSRVRLQQDSGALQELLAKSTYPRWLQNAMLNAVDSVVCNTVLPKDGGCYTLEGVDWKWYFGGLCGTNDQRLSANPYLSTFFPELDKAEVESFRLLHRGGEVPHGNGNCDLGLGTAEIPYGWPVRIMGALEDLRWPDLTLSEILQIVRLYRLTGDEDWLSRSWEDVVAMCEALHTMGPGGIPQGGSTFDTFSFPGMFLYTMTLYLAALDAVGSLCEGRDASLQERLRARRRHVTEQVEAVLWDARGFYRATEHKDTLFLGGLAGDWFARYMGLNPVLPLAKVRSHLRHQHRVLIAGRDGRRGPAAFVDMEATFKGKAKHTRVMGLLKVYGYAWQVLSYHGLESIYVGLVEEGLETLRMLESRIWHGGWPWSADLYGNAGAIYMTHPVWWAVSHAIAGAALDVPERTLRLSPRWFPQQTTQKLPVFFPSFWALLHLDRAQKTAALHIEKHFGEPLQLETLQVADADGQVVEQTLEPCWEMRAGRFYTFALEPSVCDP